MGPANALSAPQKLLAAKNIPLFIHHHPNNRFKLASTLLTKVLPSLQATHMFGNIEYEVDELRRDIEVVRAGHAGEGGAKVKAVFVHDRLAVPPGKLKSGKGTPYGVYSPWQRCGCAELDHGAGADGKAYSMGGPLGKGA